MLSLRYLMGMSKTWVPSYSSRFTAEDNTPFSSMLNYGRSVSHVKYSTGSIVQGKNAGVILICQLRMSEGNGSRWPQTRTVHRIRTDIRHCPTPWKYFGVISTPKTCSSSLTWLGRLSRMTKILRDSTSSGVKMRKILDLFSLDEYFYSRKHFFFWVLFIWRIFKCFSSFVETKVCLVHLTNFLRVSFLSPFHLANFFPTS